MVYKASNCAQTPSRNPDVCCATHVRLNQCKASKNPRDIEGELNESTNACRSQTTWDQDAKIFKSSRPWRCNIKTKGQDLNSNENRYLHESWQVPEILVEVPSYGYNIWHKNQFNKLVDFKVVAPKKNASNMISTREENQNQTKLDTKSLPFSERGKKEIQRTRSSNTVNANDRGTRGSIHRRASAWSVWIFERSLTICATRKQAKTPINLTQINILTP